MWKACLDIILHAKDRIWAVGQPMATMCWYKDAVLWSARPLEGQVLP